MNIEEQLLPIVPFGKYKDKSVLDLLADKKYVEWLKLQSWFSNQKQIYNIVVHQTISTTNNSKTPEHNKLQNLFLDKSNQQKLLSHIFNINNENDWIKNLLADEDITRCFGIKVMPKFINNLDETTIKFEDKFNWDLVMYYYDSQKITITSNLETELFDKIKYKEQYDIEEQEIYKNKILSYEEEIKEKIEYFQNQINKYDENMKEYENDLNIFLQQKPQNVKDIENYEEKLNIYKIKRDTFITDQTKLICLEIGINHYHFVDLCNYKGDTKYDFMSWNRYKTYDTTYTKEEKKQLQEIIDNKLKIFIKEFEKLNIKPDFVKKLNIPIKPQLPEGREYNEIGKQKYIDKLYTDKNDYENNYKNDYENNFNKHYEEYRLQYYRDIIKKYCNHVFDVKKINENQYKISINICNYYHAVCCELKPTLSDDYPVVLRKLKTQIELTNNDNSNFKNLYKRYILIIGSFTSIDVSKEQLITIFKQSNIKVIFTDEIFETLKSLPIKYVNTNADQVLVENELIEENKFLKDNLLQSQQKLLHAEEKIKQLQEEIILLKKSKIKKSINV